MDRSYMLGKNHFASLIIMVALLCLLVSGCERKAPETAEISTAITKSFEQGPAKILLVVDTNEITVADRITLSLTTIAPEGYEVVMPNPENSFGEFTVVDFSNTEPFLAADNTIRRMRTYILEPFLAGVYTIPSLTIIFNPGKETKPLEISTEELAVTVKSLLPENTTRPDIADIADIVEPPPDRTLLYSLAAIFALLAIAALVYWFYFHKNKPEKQAPPVPAHIRAYQELDALVALGLVERGEIKRFYSKVSDIFRHYIENRFFIKAPEQTTEEFFGELGSNQIIPSQHKPQLKNFLTHCDLVKFAKHRPSDEKTRETVGLLRNFIKETEPHQEERTL
ncbi:MAG: BatD family protein [Proteobacteria bacterium]|nr:BatD family protein [Pseudomonadota bacterium]MBU1710279.1 BatD family protein [Pseudomonadota bacterium]